MIDGLEDLVRKALQWMVDCWNSVFEGAEDIGDVFCFYISPFLSVTARQPHATALPLKSYFYCPLRGRRSRCSLSLSLAKGRRIVDSPPDSEIRVDSILCDASLSLAKSRRIRNSPPDSEIRVDYVWV